MMDSTPYEGTLRATARWGVKQLYDMFLIEKQVWGHALNLEFKSERKGFLNTRITITCTGPKDLVVLWSTTFVKIANMEAGIN